MNSKRPDRGLSKSQRIAGKDIFDAVFSRGRRFYGDIIVMLILPGGAGDSVPRLGVVAGKRTFRRSVDRARAKRRMREAFRLERHRFQGDYDVILLARACILERPFREIIADLDRLAARAGMLGNE